MSRLLKSCVVGASALCVLLAACSSGEDESINNRLTVTTEILVTSEAGDKLATKENVSFQAGDPSGTTIAVSPGVVKQTIVGIGSSFGRPWGRVPSL